MDAKKYYILVVFLAVLAGAIAFYLYKLAVKNPPLSSDLNNKISKSLTNTKSPKNVGLKTKPKPSFTVTQLIDANAKVNEDLASSLKVIKAALSSGERSFSIMQQIYGNFDYNNFFSQNNLALKFSAEQSKSQAEESFLYSRSSLMEAQSDAKANVDASLDKTLTFLDDLILAMTNTRNALLKSTLTASIGQTQLDDFINSVDGGFADITTIKISLLKTKSDLNAAVKDQAYETYLKQFKEIKVIE